MAENTDISDIFKKENNPIKKFAKSMADNLAAKAEDKLVGAISDAFAKVGLGQSSGKSIASQLGDAIIADLASEFFGALGKEINRTTKEEIENNRGLIDAEVDNPGVLEPEANAQEKVLRFPSTLNDYHMRLEIKQYKRPVPNVKAQVEVSDVIVLPLPRTLEDRHELNYDSSMSLGMVGAIGSNAGRDTTVGVGQALKDAATESLAYAGQSISGGGLGNQIFSIMQQMAGAIPNPHISALFKSATLRRHRFDWLLAPNNPEESDALRAVLLRLKQASLPAFVGSGVNLLEMPEMIKVKLMPWASASNETAEDQINRLNEFGVYEGEPTISPENNNLFTFKHCVIENISINYAPDSPTFFAGENPYNPAPAFVLLSLSLIEIEYFTADDFGRKSYSKTEDLYKNLLNDVASIAGFASDVDSGNTAVTGVGANTTPVVDTTSPPKNGNKVGTSKRYVNNLTGSYAWETTDGNLISSYTASGIGTTYTVTPANSAAAALILIPYSQELNYTANTNFVYTDNGNKATPTNQ